MRVCRYSSAAVSAARTTRRTVQNPGSQDELSDLQKVRQGAVGCHSADQTAGCAAGKEDDRGGEAAAGPGIHGREAAADAADFADAQHQGEGDGQHGEQLFARFEGQEQTENQRQQDGSGGHRDDRHLQTGPDTAAGAAEGQMHG